MEIRLDYDRPEEGPGSGPLTVGWFLAPLALLVAHSFAHAWFQSRPYFVVHSGLGLRLLQVNWAIPVVGALAALSFLWLLRRSEARFLAGYERYRRAALWTLIGVTLVVAVYGWFVRPVIGAPVSQQDFFSGGSVPLTDHENWRRLGWYLSPVGVWLGVAGVCRLIWRVNRRTVMCLAVGALFAARPGAVRSGPGCSRSAAACAGPRPACPAWTARDGIPSARVRPGSPPSARRNGCRCGSIRARAPRAP